MENQTNHKQHEPHAQGGVIYTCPMHPQIKRDKPGSCPICGMTLVPEKGGDSDEEEEAYRKMAKKFWNAVILSVPVLIIAMSDYFPLLNLDDVASKKVWSWIEFVLASPVVFYSSWDFFRRGWSSIRRWSGRRNIAGGYAGR